MARSHPVPKGCGMCVPVHPLLGWPLLSHPLSQGSSEASKGWFTSRQAGDGAVTNRVDTVHDYRAVSHNSLTCGVDSSNGLILSGICLLDSDVSKHTAQSR